MHDQGLSNLLHRTWRALDATQTLEYSSMSVIVIQCFQGVLIELNIRSHMVAVRV